MDFKRNITPIEVIKKKELLEELILEIFILVLLLNGIRTHGKNLMS